MKRKFAGVAIAMLVAVFAAGCGGGDDDDGGGGAASTDTATTAGAATTGGDDTRQDDSPPPSGAKAQFISRADAICKSTESKIGAAATKLRGDGAQTGALSKDRVAAFFRSTSVPAYERMVAQLRELEPPQADEQEIDRYLRSLSKAVGTVKANPKKYASREAADPFATANKRARDYGLKVCGS